MSYALLTITREDASSFNAVGTSGEFSIETSESDPPIVVFTGTSWIYLKGAEPVARTDMSRGGATSSTLFVQYIAGTGGAPSRTRYLLLESEGTGFVSFLDGSGEVSFNPGEFVDVTNSTPPTIGAVQTYDSHTGQSTPQKVMQASSRYTAMVNPA